MLGNPDEKVIDSMYYKMFGLCFRIKDMKVKSYVPSTYILAVLRYNTILESQPINIDKMLWYCHSNLFAALP